MARGKPNGTAAAALGRKAPTMKHRLSPRGGQRNVQAEYIDLADDEIGSPVYDSTPVDQPNTIEVIKATWRACPIGYANGKTLVHRSTTDADVIKWLQEMDDAIGKL